MIIKCPKCKLIPKIDIFDEIQAIRFICDNKDSKHCGLLSVNNFYKIFLTNYQKELENFIENSKQNYKKINNLSSSVVDFLNFQNEFELLLKELTNEYQKLQNYFNKILFVKEMLVKENINSKDKKEYYFIKGIIKGMKDIINEIKNTMLITQEYPKIRENKEILEELDLYKNIKIDLNDIKKDFEYFGLKRKNCSIKKLYKFELNDKEVNLIRHRKLLKLNKSMEPAFFLYSYTEVKKGNKSSFIKVYDKYLNLLFFSLICPKKISSIIQLKDNSLLLILYNEILIIKIDIKTQIYYVIQKLEKKTKFYHETLLDNDKISLLIPLKTKNNFYLKNNNDNKLYFKQKVIISQAISENIHFINNYNFIILSNKNVIFYEIICNYDKNESKYAIEIKKDISLITKDYLIQDIYFINKDNFIICDLWNLYLISFPYKEIIAIYSGFYTKRIFTGFDNECYLMLNHELDNYSIIKQISFNEDNLYKNYYKGEIIVEGHTYLEDFNYQNRNNFIDLGDIICYIKFNQKEEDEIEYDLQYKNK